MNSFPAVIKHSINAGILTLIFSVIFVLQGCGTTSETGDAPDEHSALPPDMQQEQPSATDVGETWVIREGEPRYLRPRTWNLLHQSARISFDFEQQAVKGSTEMLFTNKRHRSETLILDSKTTELHSVTLSGSDNQLAFRQDSAIVAIDLGERFHRGDTLSITLDFTSFPPRRGLYFVDPLDRDPTKPTQVWTLGQPEDNSFWIPTIDHPAERTTQEFRITVPDSMKTFSNGFLISQTEHPDTGERTDYWRLDIPHTPYLFALAAGVFDVTERWVDDIYYAYYTEPRYADYVEQIYAETEDMIAYFNEKFDYAYPWGAYMQVPVHEYIARGMENTTATILYDLVQVDARAAQDVSHMALITHEVVHQWFGNLVTCKDWANLPFNEGFANYFETLYKRDSLGYEQAMWHSLNHKEDYFAEAQDYRRPVIFNQYTEPEDMYDRHTYAKSGQILGMLHNITGEEIWWAGLHNFLHTFEFQAVDMRDVQHIFEQETGQSLHWFFDQWFYEPGHPELHIAFQQEENEGDIALNVEISQIHNTDRQPLFRLESELEIITENGRHTEAISITDAVNRFTFETDSEVLDVIFDPAGVQLTERRTMLSSEQIISRLTHPEPATRFYTLQYIEVHNQVAEHVDALLEMTQSDSLHPLRAEAFRMLAGTDDENVYNHAMQADYDQQPHYEVRRNALRVLQQFRDREEVQERFREAISDTSYFVSAEALKQYAAAGYEDALETIEPFHDVYSWNQVIRSAVVEALQFIGSDEAFILLMKMAAQPGDFSYKSDALTFISGRRWEGRLADQAYELYRNTLDDPYVANRMHAIRGLARAGDEQSIHLLREYRNAVAHPDEQALLDEVTGMP